MHALRDLQRDFYQAIACDETERIAPRIRSDGIAPQDRIRIYRNNSQAAFLSTLSAAYPVIARLGGEDWFRQVGLRFQSHYPSRCGDLQYAGESFAAFLDSELSGTEHHYFADVARLEWAYQQVLTAAEGPTLDPTELGAVADEDYDRLLFKPRATVRLVESAYPILSIWRANQAGAESTDVSLDSGPSRIVVLRRPECIELRELSPSGAALLAQFLGGACFGAAAAHLNTVFTETEFADGFRELLALQTLGDFLLDDPE